MSELFNSSIDQIIISLFFMFGWIPIIIVLLWGGFQLWMDYITGKWFAKQKFKLLAIDIPRGNEQSMLAVENLFTYFGGAHGSFNLVETYWLGMFQLGFSFEIVNIDGYTQFLIHTPAHFRNLVESAVYSQYPDAEITEVEDYTKNMPDKFPDDEYDLWGAEFIPVKPDVYPIKTYLEFEDQIGKPETHFKDPLSSLMDLYSSLLPGEQIWYQIIVVPTDFDWVKRGDIEISKAIGEKVKPKDNIVDKIINAILKTLSFLSDIFTGAIGDAAPDKKADEDAFKMLNLKPVAKKQMEAIQRKVSKQGFLCKIRFIYLARKEVMNKPKAVNGFVGYIKQFMDLDLNNFKPDIGVTATTAAYFFVDRRLNTKKTNIMSGYKGRSGSRGRSKFILNTEELATLWHFPVEAVVKAPLIQKAAGRKAEPPMSLPFDESKVGPEPDTSAPVDKDEIFSKIDKVIKNKEKTKPNKKATIDENIFNKNNDFKEGEGRLPFDDDEHDNPVKSQSQKGQAPGNLPFV